VLLLNNFSLYHIPPESNPNLAILTEAKNSIPNTGLTAIAGPATANFQPARPVSKDIFPPKDISAIFTAPSAALYLKTCFFACNIPSSDA